MVKLDLWFSHALAEHDLEVFICGHQLSWYDDKYAIKYSKTLQEPLEEAEKHNAEPLISGEGSHSGWCVSKCLKNTSMVPKINLIGNFSKLYVSLGLHRNSWAVKISGDGGGGQVGFLSLLSAVTCNKRLWTEGVASSALPWSLKAA